MMLSSDGFDLATMPAFAADAQAAQALLRGEAHRAFRERRIREVVQELCGVTLPGSFAWRTHGDSERFYVAAVHDFSAPMIAEARVTILSHHYNWTRKRIMEFGEWLGFEIGLRRVVAHIRPGDFRMELLAQRACFRMTGGQSHDEAGRVVNVWSAAPEDIMFLGFRGIR